MPLSLWLLGWMQDGSWLLGHFRYPCIEWMHMQISHKVGKERKTTWEKPSPKKRDKEDAWMDGVIKTPPLRHTSNIYYREWWEEERQDRLLPQKEECQTTNALMKKLIHECRMVFLPLGRKDGQGIDEMLPLCMERIYLKELSVFATNEEPFCNYWS